MMVIGLHSGKEFFVKDQSYTFENQVTGEIIRAFESEDGSRVITAPASSIEYFDEEATSRILTVLEESANSKQEPVKEDLTDLYG